MCSCKRCGSTHCLFSCLSSRWVTHCIWRSLFLIAAESKGKGGFPPCRSRLVLYRECAYTRLSQLLAVLRADSKLVPLDGSRRPVDAMIQRKFLSAFYFLSVVVQVRRLGCLANVVVFAFFPSRYLGCICLSSLLVCVKVSCIVCVSPNASSLLLRRPLAASVHVAT